MHPRPDIGAVRRRPPRLETFAAGPSARRTPVASTLAIGLASASAPRSGVISGSPVRTTRPVALVSRPSTSPRPARASPNARVTGAGSLRPAVSARRTRPGPRPTASGSAACSAAGAASRGPRATSAPARQRTNPAGARARARRDFPTITARRDENSIAASSSEAGSAAGAPASVASTCRPSGSRHCAVRVRPDRSSDPACTDPLSLMP